MCTTCMSTRIRTYIQVLFRVLGQQTAPHCTKLHHTAPHCTALHRTATHCATLQSLQCTVPHCNHCNALCHTATHCATLQHTATHCTTLQHTATHPNKLQVLGMQRLVSRLPPALQPDTHPHTHHEDKKVCQQCGGSKSEKSGREGGGGPWVLGWSDDASHVTLHLSSSPEPAASPPIQAHTHTHTHANPPSTATASSSKLSHDAASHGQ